MGQIHALQRRVEVAQQGLAMFEDEARGAGARLTDAFGRIEDVLREKDFQLVRRELEVQRLARENAQARMLLETLLETVEQRKMPSLREVIEEFERRLAASTALHGGAEPTAEAEAEAPASPATAEPPEAAPDSEPAVGFTLAELMSAEPAPPSATVPPSPLAAFADPAGDAAFTVAATPPETPAAEAPDEAPAEDAPEEPAAEILPPGAVVRAAPEPDANEELIAGARAQLRSRKGGARLMEEEQRRYAYKIWLGPILLGAGTLGPLALVLASIAH